MDLMWKRQRCRARRVPRASGDGPARVIGHRWSRLCSPRERGWTDTNTLFVDAANVFPARAGMDPALAQVMRDSVRVPRASGDGPSPRCRLGVSAMCSPRERGWTERGHVSRQRKVVFPARAGMDLRKWRAACKSCSVPRASGDGPNCEPGEGMVKGCSPRERGWTHGRTGGLLKIGVFPARAGMDLRGNRDSHTPCSVPRASGDGPVGRSPLAPLDTCSPRERGWTEQGPLFNRESYVFPARAGMDPTMATQALPSGRVPRASGDGPDRKMVAASTPACSPRERGWT